MAAGNRLPTAVPDVVITIEAFPLAMLSPKAKKADDLSSRDVKSLNLDNSANPPEAIANGPERLPEQRTTLSNPLSWKALNSSRDMKKLVRAKDSERLVTNRIAG